MRRFPLSFAALALAGLAFTAAVRADEEATVKPRVEKAQDHVKALARIQADLNRTIAAVQTAGEKAPEDLGERLGNLSDDLDAAVANARSLTKPITLAELTAAEKKAIQEALAKETSEGEDDPLADWQKRALERALDGADLSEEQEFTATDIVSKWMTDAWASRKDGDSKRSSDLKRERDKALTKALGKRKARKVINNLNSMYNRWR